MPTLAELSIVKLNPEIHDVSTFDCGDEDLNEFLKEDCVQYGGEYVSQTQLVFHGEVLVAFLTLSTDSIILKTREKKSLFTFYNRVRYYPAIKIARLGISVAHQKQGIGKELIKYVLGLAHRINQDIGVGCRFITVDAYPQSVDFYKKCGFEFNKEKSYQDKTHPSMRYDLIQGMEL